VRFEYLDDVTVSGIAGYRYGMSKNFVDNGTSDPGTVCKGEEHGLPRGVVNLTACRHGTPTFISNPHFFHADPYYVSQVAGLQPDADKHQFYITLEPVSKIKKRDNVRIT
jgi:scavenger receptor class B protein 1